MVLPEDIASQYADRTPGDAVHQAHHDEIHREINLLPEALAAKAPRPGLVDNVVYPQYIAHRGGHILYPEHSMDGYRQAFRDGFLVEPDVVITSDGVLVCNHDNTADGQTNGTGPIDQMPFSTWRGLLIDAPTPGGLSVPTTHWEAVLDEFGGRALLTPEVKVGAALEPLLASIERRGLQRSVVVQSFTYTHAQTAAARGIAAAFLSSGGWAGDLNDLVQDGIEFWAPDSSVSAARITEAKSLGLRVIVWTINDKASADLRISQGADLIFSDDPQHVSQRSTKRNSDPFALKVPWAGAGRANMPRFLYADEAGLGVPDEAGVGGGMGHYWAGKRGPRVRVRWTIHYLPTTTTDTSRWGGSMYVGTFANVDTPFTDGATAGQTGYHFLWRRNGAMDLYRVDSGASATQIATGVASGVVTNQGEGSATFEMSLTATDVTVRCLDTGAVITAADTTHRSANAYLASRWNNSNAYLRAVSVEDLA